MESTEFSFERGYKPQTFGILESAEFCFKRGYKPLEEFIQYILPLKSKSAKTQADDKKLLEEHLPSQGESSPQKELTEDEIIKKSRQDALKIYYHKDIKKEVKMPHLGGYHLESQ